MSSGIYLFINEPWGIYLFIICGMSCIYLFICLFFNPENFICSFMNPGTFISSFMNHLFGSFVCSLMDVRHLFVYLWILEHLLVYLFLGHKVSSNHPLQCNTSMCWIIMVRLLLNGLRYAKRSLMS